MFDYTISGLKTSLGDNQISIHTIHEAKLVSHFIVGPENKPDIVQQFGNVYNDTINKLEKTKDLGRNSYSLVRFLVLRHRILSSPQPGRNFNSTISLLFGLKPMANFIKPRGHESRGWNRKNPSPDNSAGDSPSDAGKSFHGSHTDNGTGNGVSGADWNSGESRSK